MEVKKENEIMKDYMKKKLRRREKQEIEMEFRKRGGG